MNHDDKPTPPNKTSETAHTGGPLWFASSDVADVAALGAKAAQAFIDQCTVTIPLGRSGANPTFVSGPCRSGMGASIVVPSLLTWDAKA